MNTNTSNKTRRNKPELLAPAGSFQAFRAALAAGADAIYLGLDSFNARRNADNIALDELEAVCDMAHLSGCRIYLTANTLVLDGELDEAFSLVMSAYERGIDAAIVADVGLMQMLASQSIDLELHASTQMNIHTAAGIDLARQLGASRVTLARELSLDELSALSQLGVDLEVFAHGALCVCYSGQCLMSSLIGRRSANRGLCAQPCRLPWTLMECPDAPSIVLSGKKGVNKAIETSGDHLLSPKDLCTIDILPALIASGVASLKIEGRMKSPEYVSLVVGAYRGALDRAYEDPENYRATSDEHDRLEEAFSRGFTTGYLEGERGNEMMSYLRPNNRGVLAGRVSALRDGLVEISCERALSRGDVLEFWTSRGRPAQTIDSLMVEGREVAHCEVGDKASLVVDRPVAPGDRVFRVRNARLMQEAKESFEGGLVASHDIDVHVEAYEGKPLSLMVSDDKGNKGRATGGLVEAARTRDVTSDDIKEHVGRLGGTPYRVKNWDIALDEGVGMGFSTLHALRREALAAYEDAMLSPWHGRSVTTRTPQISEMHRKNVASATLEIAVLAPTPSIAAAAHGAGADIIYAPALEVFDATADCEAWDRAGHVVPVMPTVVHESDFARLEGCVFEGTPVVSDGLAMLTCLAKKGACVEAGQRSGVMNAHAAHVVESLGATRLWLSPELSMPQIAELAQQTELSLTITVFGCQELMITEHCALMAEGPCGQNCETCRRRRKAHVLHDRKDYDFPLSTDICGRSHVYNSVPLDAMRFIGELADAGVSRFVIDATLLAACEVGDLVKRARQATDDVSRLERIEKTTTGHLFRGVL